MEESRPLHCPDPNRRAGREDESSRVLATGGFPDEFSACSFRLTFCSTGGDDDPGPGDGRDRDRPSRPRGRPAAHRSASSGGHRQQRVGRGHHRRARGRRGAVHRGRPEQRVPAGDQRRLLVGHFGFGAQGKVPGSCPSQRSAYDHVRRRAHRTAHLRGGLPDPSGRLLHLGESGGRAELCRGAGIHRQSRRHHRHRHGRGSRSGVPFARWSCFVRERGPGHRRELRLHRPPAAGQRGRPDVVQNNGFRADDAGHRSRFPGRCLHP